MVDWFVTKRPNRQPDRPAVEDTAAEKLQNW